MSDARVALCPFCQVMGVPLAAENDAALAFRDSFPVAEGHTLVIPRRHVFSIFDAPPREVASIWTLVAHVRDSLTSELHPDGFSIGVNDGAAAGQTVGHGHVHVIPRRSGDVPDPRGGIRWVIPEKAAYWNS